MQQRATQLSLQNFDVRDICHLSETAVFVYFLEDSILSMTIHIYQHCVQDAEKKNLTGPMQMSRKIRKSWTLVDSCPRKGRTWYDARK
jgi:ribosomal silencing factor RsfS